MIDSNPYTRLKIITSLSLNSSRAVFEDIGFLIDNPKKFQNESASALVRLFVDDFNPDQVIANWLDHMLLVLDSECMRYFYLYCDTVFKSRFMRQNPMEDPLGLWLKKMCEPIAAARRKEDIAPFESIFLRHLFSNFLHSFENWNLTLRPKLYAAFNASEMDQRVLNRGLLDAWMYEILLSDVFYRVQFVRIWQEAVLKFDKNTVGQGIDELVANGAPTVMLCDFMNTGRWDFEYRLLGILDFQASRGSWYM